MRPQSVPERTQPSTYLDHNASTPVRAEVVVAMAEVLSSVHGNPSSTHAAGRRARACVEDARRDVAALIGVQAEEIVFTSGGTEGDNLAIRGLALAARARRGLGPGRGHVVSSPLEHPAVLGALEELEREGFAVTLVPVTARGEIDPADVQAALRDDTVLVTLATANHELGNQFPVARLAAVAHAGGAFFHTDAVAAAGKIRLSLGADGADAATVSAHKLGGPKGTGAIFVRQGVALHVLVAGGHQERERRAGTENVAAIVGFGVAARLATAELDTVPGRLDELRQRLEQRLLGLEGARLHGVPEGRVPGTTNVGFAGAVGQLVAINLDLEGVAVSTGAACTSGSLAPSPVLRALGLTAPEAAEGVRISLGRSTTVAEIDRVADLLPGILRRLRQGPRTAPAEPRPRHGDAARERVVVAMSGGVDSSTAAALLLESGVEVVGVTLKLYDASGTVASIGGRCCSPRDIEDARATAAALGFPHYVIDESQAFGRAVIDDFVGEHRIGRTPNPCVRCNEKMKFGPLVAFAQAIGATALATGHYARLSEGAPSLSNDGPRGERQLLRALDRDKDQSYFLFGVRPEIFTSVRFPLGDRTKEEVRAIARRFGLANADKPDSQEICFIPDGNHQAFVEARGGAGRTGVIRDEAGASLGEHAGTHRFTVGQRRGVPASGGTRRFVLRVEPATGDVVVGPRASLGRQTMRVSDVRWLHGSLRDRDIGADDPLGRRRCEVQIRHHAVPAPAWIVPAVAPLDVDNSAPAQAVGPEAVTEVEVHFDAPAHGVAPGQAAVFYQGDRVLGGGWIV